jgi:hypothetical protein
MAVKILPPKKFSKIGWRFPHVFHAMLRSELDSINRDSMDFCTYPRALLTSLDLNKIQKLLVLVNGSSFIRIEFFLCVKLKCYDEFRSCLHCRLIIARI